MPDTPQDLITADPDWRKAGCSSMCRTRHTHTAGYCALVPAPAPTISVSRVETTADGQPGIVLRSVPAAAWEALISVARWVSHGTSPAPDVTPEAAARQALSALHDAGLLTLREG